MMCCRIAVFNFLINENVHEPTISFVSEDPSLQYVSFFHLCVGRLKQYYEPDYHCFMSLSCTLTCVHVYTEFPGYWKMHRTR